MPRTERKKIVECYQVMHESLTDLRYCDQGDETLLGRYVERLLRGGARAVVIDRVRMTQEEADAIPAEKMVG